MFWWFKFLLPSHIENSYEGCVKAVTYAGPDVGLRVLQVLDGVINRQLMTYGCDVMFIVPCSQ